MKAFLFIFLILLTSDIIQAQESIGIDDDKVHRFVQQKVYFIAGNYLINLIVISTNEQISKFNFADLKQTLKSKTKHSNISKRCECKFRIKSYRKQIL